MTDRDVCRHDENWSKGDVDGPEVFRGRRVYRRHVSPEVGVPRSDKNRKSKDGVLPTERSRDGNYPYSVGGKDTLYRSKPPVSYAGNLREHQVSYSGKLVNILQEVVDRDTET